MTHTLTVAEIVENIICDYLCEDCGAILIDGECETCSPRCESCGNKLSDGRCYRCENMRDIDVDNKRADDAWEARD